MALNTVSLPFGYYPDPTQGRPVFNGSIFIGEPDTDPTILANQKTITIRQEGVDTPSVPQPISTSAGGVPVFNGSPAEILVDGSYSMAVLNAQDSQVYYVANQTEPVAEYNQGGTGAVTRTVESKLQEIVSPEDFGATGDGIADDSTALDNAFAAAENGVLLMKAGKTYTHETDIVVPKNITVLATGAVIKKTTSAQGPGHFIGMNGDKTDIANPIPLVNITWIGGDIDVNNFSGVNGFGIEVVDGVLLENVSASNALHDSVTEGGRGFTNHPRSRNVSLINCEAINCSHGFDESFKSDNLISRTVTGATSANPIVITSAGHGFTNGQSTHAQQFSGDFTELNGHQFVVASATTDTFALTGADGSGFGAYVSGGVMSLADEGAQRNRNNSMLGCIATDCDISALTLIQANNSRDLSLKSCDLLLQGFKAFNCGTLHTAEWGVINSSASVGVQGNIQVFNDSDNPVGAVFRGSMHKWNITADVDVHTCDSLIEATPLVGVDGLDSGVTFLPEGVMQECKFDISFSNEVLNTAVINTTDVGGNSIDNIYRNVFDIRLSNTQYTDSTPFAGVLTLNATHFTNYGRFVDLPSGRVVEFHFDDPIGFGQVGLALPGLTIDGESSSRADLDLDMGGTATSARIQALVDGVLAGYLDFNEADDRWRFLMNGAVQWQITNNNILPETDGTKDIGSETLNIDRNFGQIMALVDGITAPSTIATHAQLYVDTADGDLKIKFGDGTVKTIVTDT
jgi:hypothetical protein